MSEQYGGEIPDEVEYAWNDTLDKELTSKIDEKLFERIMDFEMETIGK